MPGWAVTLLVGVSTSVLTAVIIGGFVSVKKSFLKIITDNALIRKALQALLRNYLYELGGKCLRKRHATVSERENFCNMYDCYHGLGHNGVMDDLKEKFLALPIKDPEDTQNNNTKKHKH